MPTDNKYTGRQRYRCVECGLVVEGRANSRGEVIPYDRGAWDGSQERPALCVACQKDGDV